MAARLEGVADHSEPRLARQRIAEGGSKPVLATTPIRAVTEFGERRS